MREGRIRALAVTGAKRSPFDPEIPTIAEQGFPGYAATNWYCLVVSSKVPPENVATLTTLMNKALNAPEVQAAYGKHGMETLAGTAAEAATQVARDVCGNGVEHAAVHQEIGPLNHALEHAGQRGARAHTRVRAGAENSVRQA